MQGEERQFSKKETTRDWPPPELPLLVGLEFAPEVVKVDPLELALVPPPFEELELELFTLSLEAPELPPPAVLRLTLTPDPSEVDVVPVGDVELPNGNDPFFL